MKAAILMSAGLAISAYANNVVVTENDFLMASQTYGALQRNVSMSGGPLTIAGKTYDSGLGAHAVSEIPVTVPSDASRLKGLVGMDDGPGGKNQGEASFRILSGNAVLWESDPMKTGDAAKPFNIEIPAGCSKLYLQADDLGQNDYDHSSWVDLAWENGTRAATVSSRTFSGKDFGLRPNTRDDQSAALRKALQALQKAPDSKLVLEQGTYHFWHTGALKRHIHISNHDQPTWQPVCIPLVDLHGATIEGNGSLFLFHGDVQPILIQDSDNVTLSGIAIDYEIPHHSQGVITQVDETGYEMTVDQKQFPHRIADGWFMFKGEGWERPDGNGGIVFDGRTREIVAGTSDYGYRGKLTVVSDGRYRVEKNIGASGIKVGDVVTMRHNWRRPHPGVVVYRSRDTVLHDFVIHFSNGMGLLAQRSRNIILLGGGVFPRKETGRYFSSGADATHFSNCIGEIVAVNGLYEGMMDDAINVHATCLRIEEKVDERTLRLRYVHGQAIGFEVMLPGESIRFIHAKHLAVGEERRVASMRRLDTRELLVTLDRPVPENIGIGDAVESADWHAAVTFRGNTVRNNRARGSLFTTPKRIVIEENVFESIAGSAILLAGDANGWYESGACADVLIRSNLFKNNLTSRFQFTEAIIAIFPTVPDLKGQTTYYHRNVRIEDNVFETFDVPLVFAISTDGIRFTNNKVVYNSDYPAWNKPPFIFHRCINIEQKDNQVENAPQPWPKHDFSGEDNDG